MKEEARRRISMAALPPKKRKRQPLRTKREMRAQRLVAEEAESEGKGVALKEGKFIGPPMVKMARNIIKKQELIDSHRKLS